MKSLVHLRQFVSRRSDALSIRARILLSLNITSVLLLSVFGYYLVTSTRSLQMEAIDEKVSDLAGFIQKASPGYFINWEILNLEGFVEQLQALPFIDHAAFYDDKGKVATQNSRPSTSNAERIVQRDIMDVDRTLGRLEIGYNYAHARARAQMQTLIIVSSFVFLQLTLSLVLAGIVKHLAGGLIAMRDQLKEGTRQNEQTGLGLQNSSKSLTDWATQQYTSMNATVLAMNNMAKMIEATSGAAQDCLENSNSVMNQTQSGNEIMGELAYSMDSLKASNEKLASLADIITGIENKTKVIRKIAFKSEVLSFNASIEAARAGAYGKGFAVVASEVVNLAGMVAVAATEIEKIISKSRSEVSMVVQEMKRDIVGGKSVADGALDCFKKIDEEVKKIGVKILEISNASQEQLSGVQQATKTIEELECSASQTMNSAHSLKSLADRATAQAEKLKVISFNLQDLVLGESDAGKDDLKKSA